ncbi:MAG: carboxypeptidase-like regulatory domain-containing protein [Candidatus Eremiobacteraeota bacterium]|nr:carboxypeptidase-like regulatory domain-containing protein [Candidatus Eremiobacteraeota bacterium]
MIRISLALAAIAAALALGACGNPAGPPGQYGTIKGTITSTSGQPISGAHILIDYSIPTTSKSDGTYEYTNVPVAPSAAPAVVTVSAQGFQPATRSDIVVQVAQTTVVDFRLSPQ